MNHEKSKPNPVHPVNPENPVQDKWPDINQLTHKIIGSAMAVHGTLGNGFQEVIYQRALAIELKHQVSTMNGRWKWTYTTGVSTLAHEGSISLSKIW